MADIDTDHVRRRLEAQMAHAKQEIARHQLEKVRLEQELLTLEQHNSELTSLCVASTRLHESQGRREVLTAIQEIVINLLGSEELGVFEVSEDGLSLKLVDSFGIEAERFKDIQVGAGSIGAAALEGRPFVADSEAAIQEGLTACVPLMCGDRTVGVVAVFKLLPQKGKLESTDRDLLDLLRSQAGVALYCTRILDRRGAP